MKLIRAHSSRNVRPFTTGVFIEDIVVFRDGSTLAKLIATFLCVCIPIEDSMSTMLDSSLGTLGSFPRADFLVGDFFGDFGVVDAFLLLSGSSSPYFNLLFNRTLDSLDSLFSLLLEEDLRTLFECELFL